MGLELWGLPMEDSGSSLELAVGKKKGLKGSGLEGHVWGKENE